MHTSRANPESFRSAPPSASSAHRAPEAGDTLADRYRLDREVGRTEAGAVFDAVDLTLNHSVAVEIASSLEEPKARRKWERDAMMAQRLEGEHVLRILDVGNVGGMPYAVREAAPCTVAAEIEVKGTLPLPLAVAWTLEACEAIAEAHALGMAHGDLRLDNIYLVRGTGEPSVKVAWTTAAKAERAAKEDVARDVAALGVMLRVLCTGRLVEEADGAQTLPTGLAHAVARSLSIDPRDKLANVTELARLLAPFAPRGHTSARKVALMMSRAGIVSGSIPGSAASSTALSPPTADETDRLSITDAWFGHGSRTSLVGGTLAPVPTRKARPGFAIVSAALIALVLGGSWFLAESGKLPRWTGAAPPDATGNTEVTSGAATPAEPSTVTAEPAPAPETQPTAAAPATAVTALPNAPATADEPAGTGVGATEPAAPARSALGATKHRQAAEPTTTGAAGLRYANDPPATEPATPATTTTATPYDDSTSSSTSTATPTPTPSSAPIPTSPEPTPSEPLQTTP
ncbi:MAG: serine/threonine protein kinase [Myxococcaceae bacterium]|nr:serine/threonine protein kinase [Myxococcaceae bacterium]